jgi:hypothetical protein
LRPTFSRVLSHVSEEGDTSEIDVASLNTLTHVAAYIRGKVIALGYSYSSQALMSTHASVLVDSVGPPSAEVCRTTASFP